MKGIIFLGCSFTWGQGLYFYSDLPDLIYPPNETTYERHHLTDAHLRYKDTIRYPRLVANHFNTFEMVKNVNGGSEDETFDFFDRIFENEKRFYYDDFEYMVIQLSYVYRNKFYRRRRLRL